MNGRNLSLTLGTLGLFAVAALGLTADLRNTTEIDPAGCLQSASSSPCNRKLARYYDDVYGQHVEADRENSLVTSVQSALLQLQYYPGPVDGLLGRDTQSALVAFQMDYDIGVTGAIDSSTLEKLKLPVPRWFMQ
ncbi:peptidoglycan-binding domain-containing protein [Pseudomonas sp. L7]|uniref:peptidoglycan-binding domain-containing protein n=1 Tax=Pseudomonas TaxID=286 RepID=UPI00383BC24B